MPTILHHYHRAEMLDIAAKSSFEMNLKFNPGKCQFLKFDKSRRPAAYTNDVHVDFCNQRADISTCAMHLGHYVAALFESETIQRAVNDVYSRTNVILSIISTL